MTSDLLCSGQLSRKSLPEYNVCADSDSYSIALCHFAFFHPLRTETFPLVLIMLLLFITAASGNPFLSLFHLCLLLAPLFIPPNAENPRQVNSYVLQYSHLYLTSASLRTSKNNPEFFIYCQTTFYN